MIFCCRRHHAFGLELGEGCDAASLSTQITEGGVTTTVRHDQERQALEPNDRQWGWIRAKLPRPTPSNAPKRGVFLKLMQVLALSPPTSPLFPPKYPLVHLSLVKHNTTMAALQ